MMNEHDNPGDHIDEPILDSETAAKFIELLCLAQPDDLRRGFDQLGIIIEQFPMPPVPPNQAAASAMMMAATLASQKPSSLGAHCLPMLRNYAMIGLLQWARRLLDEAKPGSTQTQFNRPRPIVAPKLLGYNVGPWCPDPHGREKPEAVGMSFEIEGMPGEILLRLKSPRAVNEMIELLAKYRDEVWQVPGTPGKN